MIFPHAFLDSSSYWNTSHNQLQLQQVVSNTYITTPSPAGPSGNNSTHPHPQEGLMATAAGGGAGDGGDGAWNGDGGGSRKSKPISMPELARLARVPQPEPGLNCPRCDSTNTKFCYYNNYSLTQPRHFCRACHRYWTRGGTLRDVAASRPYRRLAKRSAKPKEATAAGATAAGTTPSTTACTTLTAIEPSGLQYSMFGSTPTSGQFADSFDPASLARMLFADVADGGVHHHHHQGNGNVMEQWVVVQMQNLPFVHAMDHQIAGPPAASMPTTLAELQDMFHLGLQSGRNGEDDRGHHQFHQDFAPPAKRDNQQQQQEEEDYTSSRGMYADIVNGGGCGYNYYSSTSNASGN